MKKKRHVNKRVHRSKDNKGVGEGGHARGGSSHTLCKKKPGGGAGVGTCDCGGGKTGGRRRKNLGGLGGGRRVTQKSEKRTRAAGKGNPPGRGRVKNVWNAS